MITKILLRFGWYQHRKSDGHPISIWRAAFGKFPRFGSYEQHELGCSDASKMMYQLVEKKA